MEKVYARTKTFKKEMVSGFCPGCMHGTVFKLIGEVLEELDVVDKTTLVLGVGCCGLAMEYVTYDNTTSPHGRACAVATGIKRSTPSNVVYTYQGDGDLGAIGLAETMSAANRGENFTVIFVNNGIYGMTGGQMAPTTLVGMKATTAPNGRDPKEHGYPMHMCEILNQLTAPYYLERTSCNNPANVRKTKAAIKKAFENQLAGKGFSMVEIVTSCPTNWGLSPLDALDFINDKMLKEFPLGVIRDRSKEEEGK
ncbi:MAG: thiamine pyrophosphate-dependent enzyme [Oscillibacter sp.]|nr:thiamine pyrophosphate-dependent enzyme [Oscillibacter sp.]